MVSPMGNDGNQQYGVDGFVSIQVTILIGGNDDPWATHFWDKAMFLLCKDICIIIYSVYIYMGMDQYLLIPFLGGWTSIYQLFWCSPGVQGFDTLLYINNM